MDPKQDEAHVLLAKAGFINQAYSGVFQLLPLGLRVQEKIEKLIDHHMRGLGASKLSLSSLSTEGLWRRSRRLGGDNSELLKVRTRAKDAFLLAPTHEEEITKLVASTVSSPKDLPLRLYQITRKYRDERRPRQGLLRSREFVMKDLYTFDINEQTAIETYAVVKEAYTALFESLRIPFLVAEADTGNMGGSRSHEFHFASPAGEDTVFSCDHCEYIANEELAAAYRPADFSKADGALKQWAGIQKDGRTLVVIHYRSTATGKHKDTDINPHALKRVIPDIDTSIERPLERWLGNLRQAISSIQANGQSDSEEDNSYKIFPIYDINSVVEPPKTSPDLPLQGQLDNLVEQVQTLKTKALSLSTIEPPLSCGTDLLTVKTGDTCPSCRTGKLTSTQAIELGHTFHLGTRYSEPLEAVVNPPGGVNAAGAALPVPVSMGCHGIGISRMIGAIAAILRDNTGLNWPTKVAPFEVVAVAGSKVEPQDIQEVYDALKSSQYPVQGMVAGAIDVVLDDREGTLIQKLKDADLIGYPVIVALGRDWSARRMLEVQCRRLNFKQAVAFDDLKQTVLDKLQACDESK